MKMMNVFKVVFFSMIIALGLSSCDKNYYEDFQNSDEKLCNKIWYENFEVNATLPYVTHSLTFNPNGRGMQTFEHRANENDLNPQTIITHNFSWRWINNKESLVLDLGRDLVYLDAVIVRNSFMTSYYEGPMGLVSSFYTGNITLRSDSAE